jgi:rhamnogalacturonan endolyase
MTPGISTGQVPCGALDQDRVQGQQHNTAYNQPPHASFFIGNGMSNPPQPDIYVR